MEWAEANWIIRQIRTDKDDTTARGLPWILLAPKSFLMNVLSFYTRDKWFWLHMEEDIDFSSRVFWMSSHSQVHVLRWSISVMAKALFPRAWVKKSFYFQVKTTTTTKKQTNNINTTL